MAAQARETGRLAPTAGEAHPGVRKGFDMRADGRFRLGVLMIAAVLAGCDREPPTPPGGKGVAPAGPATKPSARVPEAPDAAAPDAAEARPPTRRPRDYRAVHVFVALCDNENQGIAPVPAALGNGQDPRGNLYWGAMYGVKTFFKRSRHWEIMLDENRTRGPRLARAAFGAEVGGRKVYVIADAYDGANMAEALVDFLRAAAGKAGPAQAVTDAAGRHILLPTAGEADLVSFVGHNGLMDTRVAAFPTPQGRRRPDGAIVLACRSRAYFAAPLARAGSRALLTTSGNMAPEAYTLDAAIRTWAAGGRPSAIGAAAAAAYARYQKCSPRAAQRLFVAGP